MSYKRLKELRNKDCICTYYYMGSTRVSVGITTPNSIDTGVPCFSNNCISIIRKLEHKRNGGY